MKRGVAPFENMAAYFTTRGRKNEKF